MASPNRWERALVRLSNPTGGAVLADTSMASVFIGDPGGSTTVGFAETNIAVEETATRVIATVNRMGSPSGAASVTYAAHPGTATAGNDYRPPAGNQLSWIDGDATPRTIVIPIIHDQADEVREQFELRLSAPSGATLTDAHTLTVEVNADVPGPDLVEDGRDDDGGRGGKLFGGSGHAAHRERDSDGSGGAVPNRRHRH